VLLEDVLLDDDVLPLELEEPELDELEGGSPLQAARASNRALITRGFCMDQLPIMSGGIGLSPVIGP